MPAGQLREEDVARHHDLLGRRGNPLEAEPGRDDALRASRRPRPASVPRSGRPPGSRTSGRTRAPCASGGSTSTGLPSSLTATAPAPDHLAELGELLALLADRDRRRSDRRAPSPACCAWLMTKPTAPWLSATGSVLGMAQTAVKPPAAAAIAPVATVSRSSWPGSRRCTCTSISPGATTLPARVDHLAPSSAGDVAAHRRDPARPAR